MKGITPKFTKSNKELNSKKQHKFIELGIKHTCDEKCDCESKDKCKRK